MNRRELIKRIGQCVGGLAALVVGVKAAEQPKHRVVAGNAFAESKVPVNGDYGDVRILLPPRKFDDSVVDAFLADYENNGRIRQVIKADQWKG